MKEFGFSPSRNRILVAVSGGIDSMVLVSLLHESGFDLAVAHCNYQLRGVESDTDEELVRSWCLQKNVPLYVKKVQTQQLVDETNSSIQMVARDERYDFFETLMDEHNFAATALAHHANDRIESLLINVLRGTGIRGLQGMPSTRGKFIRPLIRFQKSDIRVFAQQEKIPFRDDKSNLETYYQRNWVRLRLLPMLQQADPKAVEKLKLLCERTEDELPNYEDWLAQNLSFKDFENDGLTIKKIKKLEVPFTYLKELLGPVGFSSEQVFELLGMLDSDSGAEIRSQSHRIIKDRERILIQRLHFENQPPTLHYELVERSTLESLKTPNTIALVDANLVDRSELKLRNWKKGDRFIPLGMNGWKKLSDFFVDEKLSIIEKERVWLLTYRGEIIWVVGNRLDDRFKVAERTISVLRITLKK